ncbi:MAG TPA: SMI1/KNR4 family protein [Micromonosporaceae bacterium]|jgi:hypothetical protein
MMPAAAYALNIVHPPSPVLRIRYRDGVLIDPYGFPDWLLYARALVDLPDPVPGLGRDEMRVLDLLAANLLPSDDPLLAGSDATPAGWCWAHLGRSRRLALVPIELHGAFRHGGGVRTMPVTSGRRGLRRDADAEVLGFATGDEVPDDVLNSLERVLGWALPSAYRAYLAETNGARPAEPAVLDGLGFIADQPLFGIARSDPHQDLAFARDHLTDRFSPDLLPIGYVQGGMLVLGAAGEVYYWDDDDPADDARLGPAEIRSRLLRKCADDFDDLRRRLVSVPAYLLDIAAEWVFFGQVEPVHDVLAGAGLPPAMRAPGRAAASGGRDTVARMFQA